MQDPLLIRFSDQESITDWQATTNNSAGELRIGSGSRFVRAIETKREILVWTDTSLHSMTFIGAPFTFGITQLSANTTIIGPNAAAAVDDLVFWMGRETFYMYDGRVQQLPCAVKQKVFGDLNLSQNSMIFAGLTQSLQRLYGSILRLALVMTISMSYIITVKSCGTTVILPEQLGWTGVLGLIHRLQEQHRHLIFLTMSLVQMQTVLQLQHI